MELLIELVKLAAALAALATTLRRDHPKIEDGSHVDEDEGR